ncbi:MAG TPA: cobalamin-binding protein [Candidatus Acidoferrales bacterium]|nr:cobalamin-binding protein [Candidatus Acidoferrales bacterium]
MNVMRRFAFSHLIAFLVLPAFVLAARTPAISSPRRIVSLAPSVTETLFALGANDRLVGVTTYCDYPPAAKRLPKIGTFMNPNVELVVAQRPDLVIAVPERADREKLGILEQVGLKVLVLRVSNLSEVLGAIRALAQLTERREQGERLIRAIESEIHAVRRRIDGAVRRRVLMLVGTNPLVAVGPGSYVDELIRLAGGENVAGSAGVPWPLVNVEFVLTQAPEVIIEAGMGSERGQAAQRWANLDGIPAVKNGRVVSYVSDKILRPGPRAGEALGEIARLIHPECFADSRSTRERCAHP